MRGIKVTIPETGKVVILREPQIGDQDLAAQAIAGKSNGDQFVFVLLLNKELLRMLIHSIDDKQVSAKDLLEINKYLTVPEHNRLMNVVGKLMGTESPLDPTIESVNFGDK